MKWAKKKLPSLVYLFILPNYRFLKLSKKIRFHLLPFFPLSCNIPFHPTFTTHPHPLFRLSPFIIKKRQINDAKISSYFPKRFDSFFLSSSKTRTFRTRAFRILKNRIKRMTRSFLFFFSPTSFLILSCLFFSLSIRNSCVPQTSSLLGYRIG